MVMALHRSELGISAHTSALAGEDAGCVDSSRARLRLASLDRGVC